MPLSYCVLAWRRLLYLSLSCSIGQLVDGVSTPFFFVNERDIASLEMPETLPGLAASISPTMTLEGFEALHAEYAFGLPLLS